MTGQLFESTGVETAPPSPAAVPVVPAERDPAKVVPAKWQLPDLPFPKPPFAIPSMAEVADVPLNGLTVVSTFSGCGGGCLGFKMAGYSVLWASEFIPAAAETYRANHPGTILDTRDIRTVQPEDILAAIGMAPGEVDVMEGSPPCASFSVAGNREADWGKVKKYSDTEQRVDDLFDEFLRLVNGVRPKVVVAENVPGMLLGAAKDYFEHVLTTFKAIGYRTEAKILDAQWFGVPQCRRRLIFVGVREDLGVDPVFPAPLAYRYSVREAIPWIGRAVEDRRYSDPGKSAGDVTDRPLTTVKAVDAQSTPFHDYKIEDVGLLTGRGKIESIDRPASTLQTHGRLHTRSEAGFTFEAAGANGGRDYAPRSLDAPAPTDQFRVGANVDWKSVPRDGDTPAPTIQSYADPTPGTAGWVEVPEADRERLAAEADALADAEDAGLLVVEDRAQIEGYAIGREAATMAPGEQSEKYLNLVRSRIDGPTSTVTQTGGNTGAASVIHPTEMRKFSIAELRRLCGFPDDFVLTGTYQQQWERLGRAVMPPVYRAVAEAIARRIFKA